MVNILADGHGRPISYLRLSVTDRCDFRCVYCMAEDMQFLPRTEVLSLEEMLRLARVFVQLGVDKIRLTGGEPLVRQDLPWLVAQLAALPGLRELVLTTNGAQLRHLAKPLRQAGLARLNISLDSLQPERFRQITRTGHLHEVLAGIEAATAAGFRHTKINSLILRGRNDDEILPLVEFCRDRHLDLTFIEEMPLGHIHEHDRTQTFISSTELRACIRSRYALLPATDDSGGPARYFRMPGSAIRIGFISPHSQNFCASCNRVRVTANGRLLLCLGNEQAVDLRQALRRSDSSDQHLQQLIVQALRHKPARHQFQLDEAPALVRFMNMTGG